jgi:hypothetical protein
MKKSLLVIIGLLVILPACQIATHLGNTPSLARPTVEPSATPIDLQEFFSDMQPIIPDTGGSPSPRIHPGPRMWASFFFDPVSQQPVLYGGGRAVDAWRLDVSNGTWRMIETEYQPDPLRMGGVGAALDTHVDRLIVFFYKGAGLPGETWELDLRSRTWKNLNPSTPPASRRFTNLVYDARADKTLMFGGVLGDDETSPTNELWAYDYTANAWTQIQPENAPPPTFYLNAVYDSDSQRMVVWGGKSTQPEDAIWFYDYAGSAWEKVPYQNGPTPDYDGAMAYAPGQRQLYLYLGRYFWTFDIMSARWEEIPPIPGVGNLYASSLVYDPTAQKLVLYGGTGDMTTTWTYDPQAHKWQGQAEPTLFQ